MAWRQSSGQCRLCGETFKRGRMGQHLQTCVPQYFTAHPSSKKKHPFYLIRVVGRDAPEYWLYLLVPTRQKLNALDRFLRRVWLECCGHLSAFVIDNREFTSHPLDDFWGPPPPTMGRYEISKAIPLGKKFLHRYDFGDTTELELEALAEMELPAAADRIHLLARNAPPVFNCRFCDAPAKWVCSRCIYQGLNKALMCENCIERHGQVCVEKEYFDDSLLLPVVNSPRMGVCGYEGGFEERQD